MKDIALLKTSFGDSDIRNFRREIPANLDIINPREQNLGKFDADEYSGIVITGSKASVLDDSDWVKSISEVVRTAVNEKSVPVLGVCWGAQMIAHSLGGTVETKPKRELGFMPVTTVNEHEIFNGIQEKFVAFQSHTDYITELPFGSELLAENENAIQAFTCGSAVGVQFHPEVDYRTSQELVGSYRNTETIPHSPDATVRSWALSRETSDVLRNFVHLSTGEEE